MEIIDYYKGGNSGALFIHNEKRVTACTACESSPTFKTIRGAAAWLSQRGYKPIK